MNMVIKIKKISILKLPNVIIRTVFIKILRSL